MWNSLQRSGASNPPDKVRLARAGAIGCEDVGVCVPCLCMRGIIPAGRHTLARSSLGCQAEQHLPAAVCHTGGPSGRRKMAAAAAATTTTPLPNTRPSPKSHRELVSPPPGEKDTRAKFKTGSSLLRHCCRRHPLPPFGAAPPTQLPKHNRCLVCNFLQAFQSK